MPQTLKSELSYTIYQSNAIGNRFHYLMACTNEDFCKIRNIFPNDLYSINKSCRLLDTNSIFIYIMHIHDKSIMKTILQGIVMIFFHYNIYEKLYTVHNH